MPSTTLSLLSPQKKRAVVQTPYRCLPCRGSRAYARSYIDLVTKKNTKQNKTNIIIINTVSVMFDNYDWRMMLKLLGVSSYRRRIKEDTRLKGGAKIVYVLVG